jgi:hypothetical protein
MNHHELISRACSFLSGRGCNPIYTGNASCLEIPDAIGWTNRWDCRGSIVVECKVSVADFLRDKHKPHVKRGNGKMGDFRYFLSPLDILTAELVEKHFPDHGLLHPYGRGSKIIRVAPCRLNANKDCEVRYLKQAIVNIHGNLLARGCEFDPNELSAFRCVMASIKFPVE